MPKLSENKSNDTWFMPVRGVILVLMLFMVMPVWAGTVMVSHTDGPYNSISLNEEKGKVAPGVVLKKGDMITVHKRNSSVKLTGESKAVTITYSQNNPYTVKGGEIKGGFVESFIETISNWFVSLWKSEQNGTTAVIRGAGGRLMIPMLEGKNAQIVAKERSLHLAWIGGKAPYTVQLSQKLMGDWSQVGKYEVTNSISTTLKRHNFRLYNSYKIVVRDATKSERGTVSEIFTVVASPTVPDNLPQTKTWEAVGLAIQGNQWIFEAYQQVAGIRKNDAEYAHASMVKNGLIAGSVAGQKRPRP
ncbi:MAG: hypothetical protein VSS75_016110 [Candidatus Parabeggiatoa sp.]|nr:hypothetical protein [Candidatus Parabeggiatoa sp.]